MVFEGVTGTYSNVYKDSSGFYFEILISTILRAYKAKAKLLHVVIIETIDGKYYTVVSLSQTSMLGKQNAKKLVKVLNDIKSERAFCPKCGHGVIRSSTFCGNCGSKLSL